MNGEPEDVQGECNARLAIGDNFGDNHATMRCKRRLGHSGNHIEGYASSTAGEVMVVWQHDERDGCYYCKKKLSLGLEGSTIVELSDDKGDFVEACDSCADKHAPAGMAERRPDADG